MTLEKKCMSLMKKLSLSLFSIILFLSIITSASSFEKIIIGKANVTDGDTIKINDQKIRLFGIDAPETKQFCKEVYLSFLIGSVIITCISAIAGSMNLLNKKNFSIGGLIIMIFSIPVIIFGVNIVNVSNNIEIIKAQINVLLGIMFFFLAISPWASGLCIRISLQNK